MKNSLIALAVAGVFMAPTAMADTSNVIIYGIADLAVGSTDNGVVSATQVSSQVSKLGFKGSEDLGDGLSAIWQIEQQIDMDNTSAAGAKNTFGTRNTFAGLKSDSLGTVMLGRHDLPYKIAVRKLDVFGDNIADNRALIGNKASIGNFENRSTNTLIYMSPAFSGISAAIATVNLSETNTTSVQKTNNILSLAVMYDVAPFYASLAHESHKLEVTASGAKESANRLGFGFKTGDFELGAVYEKSSDNLGAGGLDSLGHNGSYISGKYNIGNTAVKLAYGKAGVLGEGAAQIADSGASQVSVGYDHGLSKRTKLYALYTKISNGKGINYGFSQSSAAASTTSGFGTSPSAVSLGVKHSF